MKCENCGAPLHGNKCDYCGSFYGGRYDLINPLRTDTFTHQIDVYAHQVDTLGCRMELPLEYMRDDNKEFFEHKLRKDMAYQMSEKLLDYMDVETWIDPTRMVQCFGGRIKVARPD